jgi:hypothetical protein
VRDGKGANGNSPKSETTPGFEYLPVARHLFPAGLNGLLRLSIREKYKVLKAGQPNEPTAVILVLVGDEDGIDVLDAFTDLRKSLLNAAPRKTRIDKDARVRGDEEAAIPGTTATKDV